MCYQPGRRARRWPATLAVAIVFLGNLIFPGDGSAASTQENATLRLQVEPAALLEVVPASQPPEAAPSDVVRWFRVDLAIRMRPGGTAWLRLVPADAASAAVAGDGPDGSLAVPAEAPPPPVFTARRNGRYQFRVGVPAARLSAPQTLRFVLESSDRSIHLTRSF